MSDGNYSRMVEAIFLHDGRLGEGEKERVGSSRGAKAGSYTKTKAYVKPFRIRVEWGERRSAGKKPSGDAEFVVRRGGEKC